MKKILPIILFVVVGVVGVAGFILKNKATQVSALPTQLVLATEITSTPSNTLLPSATLTPTLTSTFTSTSTFTPSSTPTLTPSLATRVFPVVVINPGITSVYLAATKPPNVTPTTTLTPTNAETLTPTPQPTVNVPKPPAISDLDLAGGQPEGWVRYEAVNPAIVWAGKWFIYKDTYRSAGKAYKWTDDPNATMALHFHGAGVRVRYMALFGAGIFEVRVDGKVMREVDSYFPKDRDPKGDFLTTEYWSLANGEHDVEVVNMHRKNFDSTGTVIGLDAIEVYRTDKRVSFTPTIAVSATPTPSATLTASPAPIAAVDLLSGPPEIPPTSVPNSPVVVSVKVEIIYNESGSGVAGVNEGVSGISCRLVEVATNRVIASGFTDKQGLVTLTSTTNGNVRLVLPYFGKFWDLSHDDRNDIKWIIPPGNVPGLIP